MKINTCLYALALALFVACTVVSCHVQPLPEHPAPTLTDAQQQRIEMLKQRTGYCFDYNEVEYDEPDIFRADCKHYLYQGRITYQIGSYTNVMENIVSEVYLDLTKDQLILLRWHMADQNAEFIDGVTFTDKMPTNK